MTTDPVLDYLRRSRELTVFCTQNGWIDNDELSYQVLERHADKALIAVEFTEVIMEGSGCVADRIACYGRLRLRLDDHGEVLGATPA